MKAFAVFYKTVIINYAVPRKKGDKMFKKLSIFVPMVALTGLGIAIVLKASIGAGAYDAVAFALSEMFGIKVGTMTIVCNLTMLLLQGVVLGKKFKLKALLQVPMSFLVGFLINFFLYTVLGPLVISNYFMSLVMFLLGNILLSFAVAMIVVLDITTFPLEGFCLSVSETFKISFPKIRQGMDVFCIILVLVLTLLFDLSWVVREGTFIGAAIFSPLLAFFMKKNIKILEKI